MPIDTELARLSRENATLRTALDTALDMADMLIKNGHLLTANGKEKTKRDLAILQDYAKSIRESEVGK